MTDEQKKLARSVLSQRRKAYALTFNNEESKKVLLDLAKFCHANESCFHPDARVHAVIEGRREVWLRIQQHLNLNDEQLTALFTNH